MRESETMTTTDEPRGIKAIETHYDGCRFRSRTEARWAVFFNNLDIKWEYEPQGYVVGGQPYLPDFLISGLGTGFSMWFEVKGQYPTKDEIEKAQLLADGTGLLTFIQFGAIESPARYPMPKTHAEFWDSETRWWYDPEFGWRNDLPVGPSKWEIGIPPAAIRFDPGKPQRQPNSGPNWWAECPGCHNFIFTRHGWTGGCPAAEADDPILAHHPATPRLKAAYAAARSARFEHGECG